MEDTIIKALLLGYTHIECNGTPIRICLKKAQGLLFYLLVHKKATRDVTAGLLADIALLASPAACFNAAVSAGQESPIYRDDTAARQLYVAVQKLRRMVSMTMMTALQAIDLSDHKAMSPVTQKLHDDVRKTVTFMENDDMMYERIEAMEALVESNELLKDCNVPFTI